MEALAIMVALLALIGFGWWLHRYMNTPSTCTKCGGEMQDCLNQAQQACIGRWCTECEAFKPWREEAWYPSPYEHPDYLWKAP